MFSRKIILGNLVGWGLLLCISSETAAARTLPEMSAFSSEQTLHFRPIKQPFGLKGAVTLGGLGLIGLELWWFLLSKTKAARGDSDRDIQEMR